MRPRQRFEVIRVFQDGSPERIIRRSVTEPEARAHCARPETIGDGWMDTYRPKEVRA